MSILISTGMFQIHTAFVIEDSLNQSVDLMTNILDCSLVVFLILGMLISVTGLFQIHTAHALEESLIKSDDLMTNI